MVVFADAGTGAPPTNSSAGSNPIATAIGTCSRRHFATQ
jgi:hypothetical protein